MYANVVTSPLPAEFVDRATATIKENSRQLTDAPGFQHAYWVYDRDNNSMVSVVVFETREQAEAAWAEAGPGVTERASAMGGEINARICEVIHHL